MRTLILGSILILIAIATRSQEAKVILLSSSDATHAESTYKALQKAQADWEVEKARLTEKYLVVGYGDPEAGQEVSGLLVGNGIDTINLIGINDPPPSPPTQAQLDKQQADRLEHQKHAKYHRVGWNDGFEFSSDFRFIVPKKVEWKPTNTCNFPTPDYTTPLFLYLNQILPDGKSKLKLKESL